MSIDAPVIKPIDLSDVDAQDAATLQALFSFWGTDRPSLRQLWAAMDFVWDSLGADNLNPAEDHLSMFYSHPIWLLNGLFIEQHEESLRHRRAFCDFISSVSPLRLADFGGGYGTLARMIAKALPSCLVEVVEPFPRREAIEVSAPYSNLKFVSELTGSYDLIVATDVFEHVLDPIDLLFVCASYIKTGGKFVVANHFAPSIKCHLPRTFHFDSTWPRFMKYAGFGNVGYVSYAGIYENSGPRESKEFVRSAEQRSRIVSKIVGHIPGGHRFRPVLKSLV